VAHQNEDTNSDDSLLMDKQQEEQVQIAELEPQNKEFSADEAHHVELPSSSWYVSKPTADSCNFFEVVAKDGTTAIEKDVNIDFKNQKVSVTSLQNSSQFRGKVYSKYFKIYGIIVA
jgi:hypothetical protein